MKQDTKTALLKDISYRDNLESLFKHEGWKIVEKFFTNKYNEAIQRLKTAKDITRDQAVIAVLDSLMEELGISIQIGNQADKMFQQLKEKEKLNYV